MIDLKELRQNPAAAQERLRVKGFDLDINRFGELESQRKVLQEETEGLQNERKLKSKAIGNSKAAGEDITALLAEVGDLGIRLDKAKERFAQLQETYQAFLKDIPNLPHASVPEGSDEKDNVELRRWGKLPEHNFEP